MMNPLIFAVVIAGGCIDADPDEVAGRFHVSQDAARTNREFAAASLEWYRGQHVIWVNTFPAMGETLKFFEWHFNVWDAVDSCVNGTGDWGLSRECEAARLKFLLGPDWNLRRLPPPAPFWMFREIDR